MVEGDDRLFNQYGVVLVNPVRHPRVNVSGGETFINWLLSEDGQRVIAEHQFDGQQLFFPNASK